MMKLLLISFIVCISIISSIASSCSGYSDCVTCAKDKFCSWCAKHPQFEISSSYNGLKNISYCYESAIDLAIDTCGSDHDFKSYRYEDTCDVERLPSATQAFLSRWMENTMSYIGDMTILDLSLPGTHNTLSYDQSLRMSDGGIDGAPALAEIIHDYYDKVPKGIEDYIRQQGQCQDLDIKMQLDNGVRFIDGRMMYEYSDEHPTWHSLHMIQSNPEMSSFLKDIREWMDDHPSEIVVLWLSKHGSTCNTGNDQYPNVSIDAKQQYWKEIMNIFSGIVTDVTVSPINETSINTMLQRNHRLVIYASDYVELTSNSSYALDACIMVNTGGPHVDDEPNALIYEETTFANASLTKAELKKTQSLYLVTLSTSVPYEQMWYAFKIKYLNYNESDVLACANAFNIPDFTWCPETLLDIANLENYYKQISLDEVIAQVMANVFPDGLSMNNVHNRLTTTWSYPGAIYLNGLDVDGTIRTGTRVLWGEDRNTVDVEHQVTSYAYSSSLVLYNVMNGCYGDWNKASDNGMSCLAMVQRLVKQRAEHPLQRWDDVSTGRYANWP